MSREAFAEARARLAAAFEDALGSEIASWTGDGVSGWPPRLVASAQYALGTGGKRIRPLLALMAAEATGRSAAPALPWALAVELVHTYSLVHDDLPAMDDDNLRRGRPTCHKVYGEALAILTGDVLLTQAFAVLAAIPDGAALVGLLATAAGGAGMVGGQVLDVDPAPVPDLAALERLHRLKTGALLRASAEGAVVAAGAPPAIVAAIRSFGGSVGLLFQITDDLLDREQDAAGGNRGYFDHLAEPAVLARRDAEAAAAHEALGPLGERAVALHGLVDFLVTRET